MKLTGPYLTLVGGLTVAGVLLALSTVAARRDDSSATPPAALAPVSAQSTAEATDTPSPVPPATSDPATEPASDPELDPVPDGTYAGSVKGGGASIAVAVNDGRAIAYVCDGSRVEAWLQGASDASPMTLKGRRKAGLTAEYEKGRLSGTVKANGRSWTFRVKAVKAPSGLYRAARRVRNATVVSGWIIADGKQVGMVSRSTGGESAAPPLDLTSRTATIDGTQVQATVVDGSPVG
jgi:hypothetical protein